jgi:hypothetical protein
MEKMRESNHWVQATPDYACVFFVSQGSGGPDPGRSPRKNL